MNDEVVEVEARPGQQYVMRTMRQGDRISEVIKQAIREYLRRHGKGPRYVYMRKLPNGVRIGYVIVHMGWEIMLLQADWVPAGCVMVGEPGEPLAETDDQVDTFEAIEIVVPMVKA